MKYIYTVLLFSLIFSSISKAQSNFKPGYIVTLKGDSINGNIDYKEWYHNPKSVRFKGPTGDVKSYNVTDITAFGVNGQDFYERSIMAITMDDIVVSRIADRLDTAKVTDTIFLRVITKGKNVKLYTYRDDVKNRYIIADGPKGQAVELSFHQYRDSANYTQINTINSYRNQLLRLAYKYDLFTPALRDRIARLDYSSDIVGIVNKLNGDSENKTAGKSRIGSRLFAGLGINSSTLTYSGDGPLGTAASKSSLYPEIHAGIDLFENSNVRRFYLRTDLSFSGAKYAVSHVAYTQQVDFSQQVELNTISLSPQLVYNVYNSDAVKFFLGIGAKINQSFYSKNIFTDADIYQPSTKNNYPQMKSLWIQSQAKAGITINSKIELYASYAFPAAMTIDYVYFSGDVTTFHGGINYLFGATK